MKTIIEKGKWTEIITKIYHVERISHNPYMYTDKLKEEARSRFNQNSTSYLMRMSCNCCKKIWINNEPVYLCYLDDEKKLICGDCKSKLS